jgi:hypothetical protein
VGQKTYPDRGSETLTLPPETGQTTVEFEVDDNWKKIDREDDVQVYWRHAAEVPLPTEYPFKIKVPLKHMEFGPATCPNNA